MALPLFKRKKGRSVPYLFNNTWTSSVKQTFWHPVFRTIHMWNTLMYLYHLNFIGVELYYKHSLPKKLFSLSTSHHFQCLFYPSEKNGRYPNLPFFTRTYKGKHAQLCGYFGLLLAGFPLFSRTCFFLKSRCFPCFFLSGVQGASSVCWKCSRKSSTELNASWMYKGECCSHQTLTTSTQLFFLSPHPC